MGKIHSQYTRPKEVNEDTLSEQLLGMRGGADFDALELGELRQRRARRLRDTTQTYESLDYDRCENQLYVKIFLFLFLI